MLRKNEVANIYDKKCAALGDPQEWETTLKRISNFWRLSFTEALLLTEQNPNATVCGTMKQWNNVKRFVKLGERSIAIFKNRSDPQLTYIFDITQTYGKAFSGKWQMSEDLADALVGMFNSRENEEIYTSLEDFLQKSLDKQINIVYNYNSKLNLAVLNDIRAAQFICESAECICLSRCGIEKSYNFNDAANFNGDLSIVEIGNAAVEIAQNVLQPIEDAIRRKEYEQYRADTCGRSRYPLREGRERISESEVRELRQRANDTDGAESGRSDERAGSDSARYDKYERTVSDDLERDRRESGERSAERGAESDENNNSQQELQRAGNSAGGNSDGSGRGSLGIAADERELALEGSTEIEDADEDREHSSEYLKLNDPIEYEENIEEAAADDETDAVFFLGEDEKLDPDSDYGQKLLREEIAHGSGFVNGKFRVEDYVRGENPNNKDLAKFLREAYGIGGGTRDNKPVAFADHDGKGIRLRLENGQSVDYSWITVAKAVKEAVSQNTYITDKDRESRARMALWDAERFSIHYEFPHCIDNARLAHIRSELKACGLDREIKLNGKMFAVYASEAIRGNINAKEAFRSVDKGGVALIDGLDQSAAAEYAKTLSGAEYEAFVGACRNATSEIIDKITEKEKGFPSMGFTDEEINNFFSENEALSDETVSNIAAKLYGYLCFDEKRNSVRDTVAPQEEPDDEQLSLFDEVRHDVAADPEIPEPEQPTLETLIAYRLGDFYEFYDEDAQITSKLLNLTLTKRNGAPMTGVPVHTFDSYKEQLSALGYSVNVGGDSIENILNPPKKEPETAAENSEKEKQVRHDVAATEDRVINELVTDYHFPEDFSYLSGAKAKYTANITAIKTLKRIEAEHRDATVEEQAILAQYSGWGGIADAFDDTKQNWSREYAELKDLLTPKEYAAARESILTAFYTEPYIIESIYKALGSFGFKGGYVLDPSMGTGNFFGCMPREMAENSRLYGVELDSITAGIAKKLYPNADIRNVGFERTKFSNGTFDVIVGNVPFGDFAPYDNEYDNYLVHDYFFVKSLDKLKPGGVMALITSSGTMDKQDSDLRRTLYSKADFVGGIRLPNDAFKTAGTQTVTDILFFRKLEREREFTESSPEPDWLRAEYNYDRANDTDYFENEYFTAHREMVLGNIEFRSGRFGIEHTIRSDGDTKQKLDEAVSKLKCSFSAEPTIDEMLEPAEYGDVPDGIQPYTFYISEDKLYYAENRTAVPESGKNGQRIRAMCGILDQLDKVISAQKAKCSDSELFVLQGDLNDTYDNFVGKYGNINSRTNSSAFKDDVRSPRLFAIENVIEAPDGTVTYEKSDIFTQRTINTERTPDHVDTALEALHLSLNTRQSVDLDYISRLCGLDKDDVISELGDRIYCNPAKNTGEKYSGWETAEEYLSGYVRSKLALAQEAAKENPEFERNIAALLDNQPAKIDITDIGFRLGTIYIPVEYVQQFIYETFETPEWKRQIDGVSLTSKDISVIYTNELNKWQITNISSEQSVLVTETYGTSRLNAYELTELSLNQKRAEVNDYREKADGKLEKILNVKETIIARECQDKIEQAFHDWIMADKTRVETIENIFNERYNNIKPRVYDGSYISIPGMNPNLTLRPHQKSVIARIAATGTCMMAHEVGAGKTAAMGAAGMYLKSIGVCNKPMYVVPNAVIGQFTEELQRFFPEAKILSVTSKDMEKSQRRRFLSKISVGNYDAVIIPQSQFEKMPLSLERQEFMFEQKISEISAAIQLAKKDRGEHFTVKALARQQKSLEAKIEKLRADFKKDDFITFEELGCDFLFVDEAQNYKNLSVFSKMNNVAGVNTGAESQRAFDMEMKCRYLQELHNGGGVVFASGTPISNSITELFVWQYLLQKQTLDDMSIGYFDNWASVYGAITQCIEVKPSGDGFRLRTRFSNFVNLPELCSLFGEVFDIAKTADMNLKLPAIKGGKPEMIICEKSPEQEQQTEIGIERARRIEKKLVDQNQDNMPAVCTYMSKVALDARILDEDAEEYDFGKVALCADKILEINREYPGKAQAVFCDMNTPKTDSFSVYQAIKDRLVRSGEFTEKEIAFVHDATTDTKRLELFEHVNKAEVKVIIGSTGKLGTGVNIQQRLIALHHLDAPYRPSDIEQRNGRGIRQGNENDEVFVGYYSTKGTFDNYRWQILEKKQQIISQVMSGKPAARSCEDIDEVALTFSEMKAATTGNPLLAEKMTVDNEVSRLKMLQTNHYQKQKNFEYDINERYPDLISRKEILLEKVKKDIDFIGSNPKKAGDDFEITLDGKIYTDRSQAAKELETLISSFQFSKESRELTEKEIGSYSGFKLSATREGFSIRLRLENAARYYCDYSNSGSGGITRISNLYDRIPDQAGLLQRELDETRKQLENATSQYGKPFPYEQELKEMMERQSKINAELEFGDQEEPAPDESNTGFESSTNTEVSNMNTEKENLSIPDIPSDLDKFYINKENESITWVYFNPDSDAGGQLVYNHFTFDQLFDGLDKIDLLDHLSSVSRQTLVDVDDPSFEESARKFLENNEDLNSSDALFYNKLSAVVNPRYSILQLNDGEQLHDHRFASIDELHKYGLYVDRENYHGVYSGRLKDGETLEDIFTRFNVSRPEDFKGHSLSVSDIIGIVDADGNAKAYYVDSAGFEEITDFFLDRNEREAQRKTAKGVKVEYNGDEVYLVTTDTGERLDTPFYGTSLEESVMLIAESNPDYAAYINANFDKLVNDLDSAQASAAQEARDIEHDRLVSEMAGGGYGDDEANSRAEKRISELETNNVITAAKVGDFYEFYGETAKFLSEKFNLALVPRDGVPMVGVPAYTFDDFCSELYNNGFIVENWQHYQDVIKPQIGKLDDKQDEAASMTFDDLKVGDIVRGDGSAWKITKITGDFSISFDNLDSTADSKMQSIYGGWKELFAKRGFEKLNQVAIESTDDYSDSGFHAETVNLNIKNPDGSFGKSKELYRLVSAAEDGTIKPYNGLIFANRESARNAILQSSKLIEIPYDEICEKALSARQKNSTEKKNTLPSITCRFSESNAFEDGKTYSVYEFDKLMKQANDEHIAGEKAALAKYGSKKAWYNANDEEFSAYIGYDKVGFTVNMPDGEKINERQDVGDGYGGVIDFLSKFAKTKGIVPVLQVAIEIEKSRQLAQTDMTDEHAEDDEDDEFEP